MANICIFSASLTRSLSFLLALIVTHSFSFLFVLKHGKHSSSLLLETIFVHAQTLPLPRPFHWRRHSLYGESRHQRRSYVALFVTSGSQCLSNCPIRNAILILHLCSRHYRHAGCMYHHHSAANSFVHSRTHSQKRPANWNRFVFFWHYVPTRQ